MPAASRYFFAAVSHVKYIKSDVVHITWRFGGGARQAGINLFAGHWRVKITEPEIKLDFVDEPTMNFKLYTT
jgi:hypothetical protein